MKVVKVRKVVPSNDSEQSMGKHMVKFKDRSGMKQYIKSKRKKRFSNYSFAVRVNLVLCITWISS